MNANGTLVAPGVSHFLAGTGVCMDALIRLIWSDDADILVLVASDISCRASSSIEFQKIKTAVRSIQTN